MSMNFNRRGIFEIVNCILRQLADGPLKKSHIGHKANLDTFTLNKYLDMLMRLVLIEYNHKLSCYTITQKGHLYLKEYEKLSMLIKEELQLPEVF